MIYLQVLEISRTFSILNMYKAEEKERKNKEEREKKKLNEETISTLLWSIEDERKVAELTKDIITRDRLGFDNESFKGEFYHGQKKKEEMKVISIY